MPILLGKVVMISTMNFVVAAHAGHHTTRQWVDNRFVVGTHSDWVRHLMFPLMATLTKVDRVAHQQMILGGLMSVVADKAVSGLNRQMGVGFTHCGGDIGMAGQAGGTDRRSKQRWALLIRAMRIVATQTKSLLYRVVKMDGFISRIYYIGMAAYAEIADRHDKGRRLRNTGRLVAKRAFPLSERFVLYGRQPGSSRILQMGGVTRRAIVPLQVVSAMALNKFRIFRVVATGADSADRIQQQSRLLRGMRAMAFQTLSIGDWFMLKGAGSCLHIGMAPGT